MPKSKKIIGIDFDNTLIGYDEVFFNHALRLNLIGPKVAKLKKNVRDQIRRQKDGEITWQKLQAFAYGQGISQARFNEGAEDFLKTCAQKGIKVYVVSHKTAYSPFDTQKINLRQAALDWMAVHGFFNGLGLRKTQVYFEPTRAQKIARLKSLGCTHFIDDLQEVFLEKIFPKGVEKILYSPDMNWKKIYEDFFNRSK
jgi:hypothetical protein